MQFIREFEFDYYLLGHDYPDNKDGVMKYLKELENEAKITMNLLERNYEGTE